MYYTRGQGRTQRRLEEALSLQGLGDDYDVVAPPSEAPVAYGMTQPPTGASARYGQPSFYPPGYREASVRPSYTPRQVRVAAKFDEQLAWQARENLQAEAYRAKRAARAKRVAQSLVAEREGLRQAELAAYKESVRRQLVRSAAKLEQEAIAGAYAEIGGRFPGESDIDKAGRLFFNAADPDERKIVKELVEELKNQRFAEYKSAIEATTFTLKAEEQQAAYIAESKANWAAREAGQVAEQEARRAARQAARVSFKGAALELFEDAANAGIKLARGAKWVLRGGVWVLEKANVPLQIAEGVYNLEEMGRGAYLTSQALTESEAQQKSSAEAVQQAYQAQRAGFQKLQENIQKWENYRRANEHAARLLSINTLGPLTRERQALENEASLIGGIPQEPWVTPEQAARYEEVTQRALPTAEQHIDMYAREVERANQALTELQRP